MDMKAQSAFGWLDVDRTGSFTGGNFKRTLLFAVAAALLVILLGLESRRSVLAAQDMPNVEPLVITGRVIDVGGQPASDAVVYSQKIGASTHLKSTKTNRDGAFEITVRVQRDSLASLRIHATSADGSRIGYFRFPWDGKKTTSDSVAIKLEQTHVASVKVVDVQGKPIANANVGIQLVYPHAISNSVTDESGIASVRLPKSERIEGVVAWKDHSGLDYRLYSLSRGQLADANATAPKFPADRGELLTLRGASPLAVSVVDDRQQPLEGVRVYPWLLKKDSEPNALNLSYFTPDFSQRTDSMGKTSFNWIPAWQKSLITVWPMSEGFVHSRSDYDPQAGSGHLTMQLDRLVPIRGRVVGLDGKPANGITVAARGAGYSMDDGSASTKTDDQGRYELLVPPDQIYLVVVNDAQWASAPQDGFAVFKNQPVDRKDFKLRKATRVFGTLIDEGTQEPVPNERVFVYQYGKDLHSMAGVELPNPEKSRRYVRPMQFFNANTDEQGRFEFALGDGKFDIRPPQQEKADKFEIAGQAELDIQVTTKTQKEVELTGLVVAQSSNTPLAGALVTGVARTFNGKDWQAAADAGGKFRVKRHGVPTYVHAASIDKQLAAIDQVGPETNNIILQLQPVGSAKGRLLTSDSMKPFAGQKIEYGVRVPDEVERTWSYRFGGRTVTEADGQFQLDGLVPGWEYTLNLQAMSDGTIPTLTKLTVAPKDSIDLGDLPAPKPRQPYVAPTLEDRIKSAFEAEGTPIGRRDRALELINLVNQHLLVVFGVPDDPRIHRLMDIRYNDRDFGAVSDEYRFLAIPTDPARRNAALELARALDESLEEGRGEFLLVILDREGKKVATADRASLCNADELSKDKLLELLRTHLTEPLDARAMLDEALKLAAKENKRVLLQETATWCGPCHRLSRFLDTHRIWEKDYIWVKMDHRWTGSRPLMAEIRGNAEGGIPWFAILDAAGKVLATSNDPKTKQNIGFPSDKDAQAHFANMLNSTCQRLSKDEISQLMQALATSQTAVQ